MTELEFLRKLLALLQEGHYKLLFMELKQEIKRKEGKK